MNKSSVKDILGKTGFYFLLLPVFFIVHTYTQYIGMVSRMAALHVFAFLMLWTIVIYFTVLLLTRHSSKAAAITTLLMSVYLFYGNVKGMLANGLHLPFLAKYIVLLPLNAVVIVAVILFLSPKRNFTGVNFYLNALLLILVMTDAGRLLWLQADAGTRGQSLFEQQPSFTNDRALPTGKMPDIYYLVFDMYPNCRLLNTYQPNAAFSLDSFLTARNFYVVQHSISNYNNTAFSMDATLNMQYLQKLSNRIAAPTPEYSLTQVDYNKTLLDINRAPLFPFLANHGYSLYNLSIFRLNNQPPLYKETFLTVPPEDVFLFNTLWSCIRRDILWHYRLFMSGFANKEKAYNTDFAIEKSMHEDKFNFNQLVLDSLPKIPGDGNAHPRMIYAHLYMPHYPFFFDDSGRRYNDTAIYHRRFLYDPVKFIRYVNYTNKRIQALTDSLLQATGGKAVIIIESDHGYPGFAFKKFSDYFRNLDAVYFPDLNYSQLHDSLSNVNTFRILLNKYFNQQMPLLPDSSIRLRN